MSVTASTSVEPPKRIVQPRGRKHKHLPVVAIYSDIMLSEDGEAVPLSALPWNLRAYKPTLFAMQGAADFIASLNPTMVEGYGKTWQWRAQAHERDIVRPDGVRVASRVSTIIHYFGFKGGNYHRIIDPVVMYGHKLDTVWPGDEDELTRLLRWAVSLRDFCHENSIDVRPTIGGIGAQFLTDRRFYPKRRRKVPMATNERGRDALPGNHYQLTVYPTPDREFTAQYLDQHRAHHYHAQHTAFPHSDFLYAYGRFQDLSKITFAKPWPNFYGLYCLDLQAPTQKRASQWVTRLERAFVFSNELAHLHDMGYRVNGVYAAWGSFKRDTGLSQYAKWAQQQLDRYGDQPWLKPLLLATYGTLATRPKFGEAVFRLAKTENQVTLYTGRHKLTGQHVRATKKLEPKIANVLQRGMIEAATRSESVGYAQHLTQLGWYVLSIYADAVIVRDDPEKGSPPIIDPWRCKETLNHLQFINQQAFTSGEMTKLPGVSRELLKYRQRVKPGYAPRMEQHEALTGRKIQSNRRI